MAKIKAPLTVPPAKIAAYLKNYELATKKTGRLFLFAGDQKVEHLNDDFFGKNVNPEDNDPEHLFKIANAARIGVFATQLGLIARYGANYNKIPYLVKLNSKTNFTHFLVNTGQFGWFYSSKFRKVQFQQFGIRGHAFLIKTCHFIIQIPCFYKFFFIYAHTFFGAIFYGIKKSIRQYIIIRSNTFP